MKQLKYIQSLTEHFSNNELPDMVDISYEANKIREIKAKYSSKVNIDINDIEAIKKDLKEIDKKIDEQEPWELAIRDKLTPIIDEYIKIKDYEGAKKFVSKSLGNLEIAERVLLFRYILLHEK